MERKMIAGPLIQQKWQPPSMSLSPKLWVSVSTLVFRRVICHLWSRSLRIFSGEIIAPEDKSHSVKDPKILKTFRINFFTALLLWKILDYIYNKQFTWHNHLDELGFQNDSGKRDFVSSFTSKVEIRSRTFGYVFARQSSNPFSNSFRGCSNHYIFPKVLEWQIFFSIWFCPLFIVSVYMCNWIKTCTNILSSKGIFPKIVPG